MKSEQIVRRRQVRAGQPERTSVRVDLFVVAFDLRLAIWNGQPVLPKPFIRQALRVVAEPLIVDVQRAPRVVKVLACGVERLCGVCDPVCGFQSARVGMKRAPVDTGRHGGLGAQRDS
jgi:hypothetical protein